MCWQCTRVWRQGVAVSKHIAGPWWLGGRKRGGAEGGGGRGEASVLDQRLRSVSAPAGCHTLKGTQTFSSAAVGLTGAAGARLLTALNLLHLSLLHTALLLLLVLLRAVSCCQQGLLLLQPEGVCTLAGCRLPCAHKLLAAV